MKEIIHKDDCGNLIATIKIGQNAKENDILFKESKSEDLWFHLKSGPSSHVWLITDNPLKNKKLVKECAMFVKEYSKCASRVKVIFSLKKYLQKDEEKEGSVILKRTPNELVT